jgi:hypothetical protein
MRVTRALYASRANTYCANGTFSTIINAILSDAAAAAVVAAWRCVFSARGARREIDSEELEARSRRMLGTRDRSTYYTLTHRRANHSSWRGDQWRERQPYRESRAVHWTFNRATRESKAGHIQSYTPDRPDTRACSVYRVCRGLRFLPRFASEYCRSLKLISTMSLAWEFEMKEDRRFSKKFDRLLLYSSFHILITCSLLMRYSLTCGFSCKLQLPAIEFQIARKILFHRFIDKDRYCNVVFNLHEMTGFAEIYNN